MFHCQWCHQLPLPVIRDRCKETESIECDTTIPFFQNRRFAPIRWHLLLYACPVCMNSAACTVQHLLNSQPRRNGSGSGHSIAVKTTENPHRDFYCWPPERGAYFNGRPLKRLYCVMVLSSHTTLAISGIWLQALGQSGRMLGMEHAREQVEHPRGKWQFPSVQEHKNPKYGPSASIPVLFYYLSLIRRETERP